MHWKEKERKEKRTKQDKEKETKFNERPILCKTAVYDKNFFSQTRLSPIAQPGLAVGRGAR